MIEYLQCFAEAHGLEFEYTIDQKYDAHRFKFRNPKTDEHFTYMIHTPPLTRRLRDNKQELIDFITSNAAQLI